MLASRLRIENFRRVAGKYAGFHWFEHGHVAGLVLVHVHDRSHWGGGRPVGSADDVSRRDRRHRYRPGRSGRAQIGTPGCDSQDAAGHDGDVAQLEVAVCDMPWVSADGGEHRFPSSRRVGSTASCLGLVRLI